MSISTSEQALVNHIVDNSKMFSNTLGLFNASHKTEVDIGYGISDVFFYQVSEETIANRNGLTKDKIEDKIILEAILSVGRSHGQHINEAKLQKHIGHLSAFQKKKVVNFLVDNRIILPGDKGGTYEINRKYRPKLKKSIAIEAKLKNWRRALFQAQRYNFVADFSYVAMPEKYSSSAEKHLEEFKKYNVGLISISELEIKIIFTPQKNTQSLKSKMMTSFTLENLLF